MNVNHPNVTYSSIVGIGEHINKLEKESGQPYLKLHRGVMDVTTIDIVSVLNKCLKDKLNSKELQQYSGNDGYQPLIDTIKSKFVLPEHKVIITPGGMASLDIVINSLSDKVFYVPEYHWGSWNKILKIHGKEIKTFDDFDLNGFRPTSGVVMLCFPSNPTGYMPDLDTITDFVKYCDGVGVTVMLDLPYYYLFNDYGDKLNDSFGDNVIILSSFSKSIGLSGYRVGFVATKNLILYDALKIRSLYKYNSISTIPQSIINELLTTNVGKTLVGKYEWETCHNIKLNIEYLKERGLLFYKYDNTPMGPFVIINLSQESLLKHNISSVPLSNFTINKNSSDEKFVRISVAVNHDLFKKYFNNINTLS